MAHKREDIIRRREDDGMAPGRSNAFLIFFQQKPEIAMIYFPSSVARPVLTQMRLRTDCGGSLKSDMI